MLRIAQITTKCPHRSRLDLPHPGNQPKQGRLAHTVRTDETDHATPGNRERHVVEGEGLAITVRDSLNEAAIAASAFRSAGFRISVIGGFNGEPSRPNRCWINLDVSHSPQTGFDLLLRYQQGERRFQFDRK